MGQWGEINYETCPVVGSNQQPSEEKSSTLPLDYRTLPGTPRRTPNELFSGSFQLIENSFIPNILAINIQSQQMKWNHYHTLKFDTPLSNLQLQPIKKQQENSFVWRGYTSDHRPLLHLKSLLSVISEQYRMSTKSIECSTLFNR